MIFSDLTVPGRLVIRADPYFKSGENQVQLRLTYEGELLGASRSNTRASHKHAIRKCFHQQLKRFWAYHPALRGWYRNHPGQSAVKMDDWLARRYDRCGYKFVPLVSERFFVDCSLSILLLRPDVPGAIIQSGDLDNRLKTIFDALRLPKQIDELGGHTTPSHDENPFYCLLEDDSLVSQVTLETDTLLEPTSAQPNQNDARLVVKAQINLQPTGDPSVSPFL